ncbi:hypothetical protein [Embleya sp. NPDC005575]|uniref:hypothetical protein n=1 Tax=Embleya sp. NPDC005575 TaxID=3156892 RepID=UPI0033AC79A2
MVDGGYHGTVGTPAPALPPGVTCNTGPAFPECIPNAAKFNITSDANTPTNRYAYPPWTQTSMTYCLGLTERTPGGDRRTRAGTTCSTPTGGCCRAGVPVYRVEQAAIRERAAQPSTVHLGMPDFRRDAGRLAPSADSG